MSALAGAVAWVTGASSGIGEALARELAARGARVAVTARGAEALEALAASRAGIVALPGDVTDEEAMRRVAAAIEERLGPLDLAVLNAGTYRPVLPETFSPGDFRAHLDVNVMGTVNCVAAVLPGMLRRRSGRLAVVASVTGYAGLPMASAYGASKAFLISMCDSLRADLDGARAGVGVSVVAPGFVRTPLTAANDFPMPFLIDADAAARAIADGLERGDAEIAVPRRMALAMKLLGRWLPGSLRRRYVAGVSRRRARERGTAG